jgi:ribosomal-protein-alanine N-acetyltransferase
MQRADAEAVAALERAAHTSADDVRAELDRPWARAWVARDEARAVTAFVIAWHVVDEIHVISLATRADVRRRGIARALMSEVLAYARHHRAARLVLEVRRSNDAALALYRSLGFFASGLRARYYADDEDAVEMQLVLDPATGDVERRADEVVISPEVRAPGV